MFLIRVKKGIATIIFNSIEVLITRITLRCSGSVVVMVLIPLSSKILLTMKNTVKIANIVFGAEVESNGHSVQLVNINLVDALKQFKVNEDGDKELKEARQLTIRMSEFTRLLVLDDYLALVPEKMLNDDEQKLSNREQLTLRYADACRLLKGAEISLTREEIYEDELDDDGNSIKDDEDKPVRTLVGFGTTEFTSVKLTPVAARVAEKLIGL
jgi:hypothetical protein